MIDHCCCCWGVLSKPYAVVQLHLSCTHKHLHPQNPHPFPRRCDPPQSATPQQIITATAAIRERAQDPISLCRPKRNPRSLARATLGPCSRERSNFVSLSRHRTRQIHSPSTSPCGTSLRVGQLSLDNSISKPQLPLSTLQILGRRTHSVVVVAVTFFLPLLDHIGGSAAAQRISPPVTAQCSIARSTSDALSKTRNNDASALSIHHQAPKPAESWLHSLHRSILA